MNRLKRLVALVIVGVFLLTTFVPVSVFADSVLNVGTNDTYNKLREAMEVSVVANTLNNCLEWIVGGDNDVFNKTTNSNHDIKDSAISVSNVKKGKIFIDNLVTSSISVPLWLENRIEEGNAGFSELSYTIRKTGDGLIKCVEGKGEGNVLRLFSEITNLPVADIVCDGDGPGLLTRAKRVSGVGVILDSYIADSTASCANGLNESKAYYLAAQNPEAYFAQVYERWRMNKIKDNPYIPNYDDIGTYPAIIGYFSYIEDFDQACSASVVKSDKNNGTSRKIARFDLENNQLRVTNKYYDITSYDANWSGGLTSGSPKNCSGLLDRISELQSNGNGTSLENIPGSSGGYEGVLKNRMNSACKEAIEKDGGAEVVRKKLQKVIEDSEATQEQIEDAKKQLDGLDSALSSGVYLNTLDINEGERDSDTGQIYQCKVEANMDTYEYDSMNDKSACYNGSGALGWVICPIIEGVSSGLSTIYDNVVEPFLTIEPVLFSDSDSNGSYIAWGIFRNIANWVFVIILLAVIFSQITGWGIDNYGIKKILPKLIVVAILINLSYIICQLAIDISNIFGKGLNSMFSGIATQVNGAVPSVSAYFGDLVYVVAAGAGVSIAKVGATYLTVALLVGSGWAVILPVLLGLCSALLSVLFMFVILIVREALVVLLVAIAPLAIASYVFPNTKRLVFDRWLSIFKGILLLYPLAGALIGGGMLSSVIIVTTAQNAAASSGDLSLFFIYLGGLLMQVVPFCLLPTLFRKSLDAVGGIGNKITGFGKGVNAGLNKRVNENEAVQAFQAKLAAGKTGGVRERVAKHLPGAMGRNTMARNRMKYEKMTAMQGAYDAMFGEDYLLQAQTANEMKRIMSSGDFNDIGYDSKNDIITGGLALGLKRALEDGNKVKIRAYTDALSMKGGSGRDATKAALNAAVNGNKGVKEDAARAFGNNLMNSRYATSYKADARSLFEAAGKAQQGEAVATSDPRLDEKLAINATADTMVSMDDTEYKRTFGPNANGESWESVVRSYALANGEDPVGMIRAVRRNAWLAVQKNPNSTSPRYEELRKLSRGFEPDEADLLQVQVH